MDTEQTPEPLPITPAPAGASAAALSTADERTWAMLAHLSVLLNLVTGALGPLAALVVYFFYRERSRYVAYHALQSFVMQLIYWVGGGVAFGVLLGFSLGLSWLILPLLCLPLACVAGLLPAVALIYGAWGGIEASQGRDFKYLWIGDWVRGTLNG